MAKVNEFETAADERPNINKRRFSPEARMHYRYSSAEELIGKTEDLSKMIQHHQTNQRPRLQTLKIIMKPITIQYYAKIGAGKSI